MMMKTICNPRILAIEFGKINISDNSKLGESQGRKATGLKLKSHDRRVAEEKPVKSLHASACSFSLGGRWEKKGR